jgi:hypothetical protein
VNRKPLKANMMEFGTRKKAYTVYRRSDGYVSYNARSYPQTVEMLNQAGVNGQTFEILLHTWDRKEAEARLEVERARELD